MAYRLTLADGSKHVVQSGSFAQGNVWMKLDGDWINKDDESIVKVETGGLTFVPDEKADYDSLTLSQDIANDLIRHEDSNITLFAQRSRERDENGERARSLLVKVVGRDGASRDATLTITEGWDT